MAWNEAIIELAEQVIQWVTGDLAKKGHLVLHVLDMNPVADETLLEIEVQGTRILRLEPTMRDAGQIPTTVNLYAYPTMRSVVLTGPDDNGKWKIVTSDGVPMRYDWSEKDFIELLLILAEPNVARRIP
jgi:hypothetical protein